MTGTQIAVAAFYYTMTSILCVYFVALADKKLINRSDIGHDLQTRITDDLITAFAFNIVFAWALHHFFGSLALTLPLFYLVAIFLMAVYLPYRPTLVDITDTIDNDALDCAAIDIGVDDTEAKVRELVALFKSLSGGECVITVTRN